MVILKWFIIGITIWCLLLLAIMPFCMAHGAEYETYFGDKFLIYHEGELGQIYIDTKKPPHFSTGASGAGFGNSGKR